jgi:hypothetical protein
MDFLEITSAFPTSTIEYRILNGLGSFFGSISWVILVSFLKTISLLLSLGLFILIVFLFVKMKVLKSKIDKIKKLFTGAPARTGKRFSYRFEKIKRRLKTNSQEDGRLAVIEADELLREALKTLGVEGKPLFELIKECSLWQGIKPEEVLKAHNLRNQAVHYLIPLIHSDAAEAVEIYEKALKDLGFL